MKMIFQWLSGLLILLISILLITWWWDRIPRPSKEARQALQFFLDLDHQDFLKKDGEMEREEPKYPALQRVVEHKKEKDLERVLIHMLVKGPSDQVLRKHERFLENQWTRREAFLKKKPNLGLKEDQLQIVRSLTKGEYIKQGREQLIRRYREKSAIALGAIGSPRAINALKEVQAKTDDKTFRKIIDAALAKSKKPIERSLRTPELSPIAPANLGVQ